MVMLMCVRMHTNTRARTCASGLRSVHPACFSGPMSLCLSYAGPGSFVHASHVKSPPSRPPAQPSAGAAGMLDAKVKAENIIPVILGEREPEQGQFSVGDAVEARFCGEEDYFRGKITGDNGDGLFSVPQEFAEHHRCSLALPSGGAPLACPHVLRSPSGSAPRRAKKV